MFPSADFVHINMQAVIGPRRGQVEVEIELHWGKMLICFLGLLP